MLRQLLITGALAGVVAFSPTAQAGVVFSDDFNSYAYELNWSPPSNWTAPGPGAVDLIGETTSGTAFDFYPGNGGFVDMEGSVGLPGTLQSIPSFAAGTYTLTFDLGGNARGDVSKTTTITLGDFTTSIILASADPLQFFSFTFTTTGGQLLFADLSNNGNQNIGNILDNVTLSNNVPEPATLGIVGIVLMSLFGFAVSRRKAA